MDSFGFQILIYPLLVIPGFIVAAVALAVGRAYVAECVADFFADVRDAYRFFFGGGVSEAARRQAGGRTR